jgi:hypothetical protein
MSQGPPGRGKKPNGEKEDLGPRVDSRKTVSSSLEEQILRRYAAKAVELSEPSIPHEDEKEAEATSEGRASAEPESTNPGQEDIQIEFVSPIRIPEEMLQPESPIWEVEEMTEQESQEPEPEEVPEPKALDAELEEEVANMGHIEYEATEEQAPEVEGSPGEEDFEPPIPEEQEIEAVPEEEEANLYEPEEEPEVVEEATEFAEPGAQPFEILASSEEVVNTLRRLREDVGQISELSAEEGNIVEAFAFSFLKIMEPLTKTVSVDISILPREMGLVERANVIPQSELVILFGDGRMESFDLTAQENRDLLVAVISNAMPKFNGLIAQQRGKIEKRIAFLSDVTRELQTIADSLAMVG